MARGAGTKPHGMAERAEEVRESAMQVADVGGDALKDFMGTAGSAAREFAATVADATRDLLETTEKAAHTAERKRARKHKGKGRLRRLVKIGVVVGAGVAVLSNEKVREAISEQVRKLTGSDETVWPPPSEEMASSEAAAPAQTPS